MVVGPLLDLISPLFCEASLTKVTIITDLDSLKRLQHKADWTQCQNQKRVVRHWPGMQKNQKDKIFATWKMDNQPLSKLPNWHTKLGMPSCVPISSMGIKESSRLWRRRSSYSGLLTIRSRISFSAQRQNTPKYYPQAFLQTSVSDESLLSHMVQMSNLWRRGQTWYI